MRFKMRRGQTPSDNEYCSLTSTSDVLMGWAGNGIGEIDSMKGGEGLEWKNSCTNATRMRSEWSKGRRNASHSASVLIEAMLVFKFSSDKRLCQICWALLYECVHDNVAQAQPSIMRFLHFNITFALNERTQGELMV